MGTTLGRTRISRAMLERTARAPLYPQAQKNAEPDAQNGMNCEINEKLF
jgi:hypothetical protein